MAESRENGGTGEVRPVDDPPRQYFDGDETRYTNAQAQAQRGEWTILEWVRYLKGAVVILGSLLVVAMAVILYQSMRPTFETKFVVRNEAAQWRVLGWQEFQPERDDMKAYWLLWLRCARGITTDKDTHQRCWARIPLFIKKDSQCAQLVRSYHQERKPDGLLFNKSVIIEKLDGTRDPDGRWSFTWDEKVYGLDHGRARATPPDTSTWHATLLTTREPPKHPKDVEDVHGETVNPLGLLCTQLSWWK